MVVSIWPYLHHSKWPRAVALAAARAPASVPAARRPYCVAPAVADEPQTNKRVRIVVLVLALTLTLALVLVLVLVLAKDSFSLSNPPRP